MNFSDMKLKDVINICDGRKLGRPIDLILNHNACIEALVVPGNEGSVWGMLKPDREGCVIPWKYVRQVGDDVVLVEIPENFCACENKREKS